MAAYRYASDPDKEVSNAFAFINRHRDPWVGANLLGEEGQAGGELSRFTDIFTEMRRHYDIPFSLHAGEIDSAGKQVHDALVLGASRIGHAVNLISDPDTILLMRHADVPIETSLVSNQMLQYTQTSRATHSRFSCDQAFRCVSIQTIQVPGMGIWQTSSSWQQLYQPELARDCRTRPDKP